MNKFVTICLVMLLCTCAGGSETWQTLDGKVLTGDFVHYEMNEGNFVLGNGRIEINRSDKGEVAFIPEDNLIHSDRMKAVRLQNKGVEPYWFSDYNSSQARTRNRSTSCLLLYRNGTDPEAFELYYHKLLLRKEFQELVERAGCVVYVQEELPGEMKRFLKNLYASSGRGREKRLPPEGALMFYGVFGRDRVIGESAGITALVLQERHRAAMKQPENDELVFMAFRHADDAVRSLIKK